MKSSQHRPYLGKRECKFCGDLNCDYSCDESQGEGDQEFIVTKSDYLESRRYNTKLYDRLINKLLPVAETYKCNILLSMSAKYQTPCMIIEFKEEYQEWQLDELYQILTDILDEVGFTLVDLTESKYDVGVVLVDFKD